jgi:hypothetical protein
MAKKMQCYTIINVITSDKEAVYDVEDFALNMPVPSTGWLQIKLKDTGGGSHGINLIPMYNGDNVTFLPMPY